MTRRKNVWAYADKIEFLKLRPQDVLVVNVEGPLTDEECQEAAKDLNNWLDSHGLKNQSLAIIFESPAQGRVRRRRA